MTLEYFLPCRHISEMVTSDSIWISLLFEQRPPCILDPAVYRSGCTYGMESQPGFETACVLCRHSGSLRNWTWFMAALHGLWRCPTFLQPEKTAQHWGWETARWGTGSNNSSNINIVGIKAAFASFVEQWLVRDLRFSCYPLTARKHKLHLLVKTIAWNIPCSAHVKILSNSGERGSDY